MKLKKYTGRVVLTLLVASLFWLVPHKASAATFIHDSFTDANGITLPLHNSTWSPITGTAYIQNNKATHDVGAKYTLNYAGNELADSCIQADLQFPFTEYAEFWLRYVNADNRNYLYINHVEGDPSKTAFGLGLVFQGSPQLIHQIALDTPAGTHNVKFCAIGNDKYLYLDDVLKLSDSETGNYPSGKQGIFLFGSGIQLDNVEVNDGESSTPVPGPVVSTISGATLSPGGTYTTTGSFTDPNSTIWTATVDYGDGSDAQPLSLSGTSFTLNHVYNSVGTYTVTVHVTNYQGSTGIKTATVTVADRQLTALDPATVWISKNLLNIGLRLDLKAEVYKDATFVSSGQINSVSVGTGGNPTSHTIPFNAFSPVNFPAGSQLKVAVYARNACSGSLPNSGTANLYFNSSARDSRFDATIDTDTTYHLLNGFLLGTSAGTSQQSISVAAGAKCSPFKSFGTWTITP